jgi:hypothetical protein
MLSTGASGAQITEIIRLNKLRFFEPGKVPSEPPGDDWWQARRHVAGAMSEAYAWYRITTAKSCAAGRHQRDQDKPPVAPELVAGVARRGLQAGDVQPGHM